MSRDVSEKPDHTIVRFGAGLGAGLNRDGRYWVFTASEWTLKNCGSAIRAVLGKRYATRASALRVLQTVAARTYRQVAIKPNLRAVPS